MIIRVISGGQTGADLGGWRAAKACGLPTGGYLPRGWMTEDCPRPEYAAMYGAVEHGGGYKERTVANVLASDGTLWFGDWTSPGGRATLDACRINRKPFLIIYRGITKPSQAVEWIIKKQVVILNVAGNRESSFPPDIGAAVERFMIQVFRRLQRKDLK